MVEETKSSKSNILLFWGMVAAVIAIILLPDRKEIRIVKKSETTNVDHRRVTREKVAHKSRKVREMIPHRDDVRKKRKVYRKRVIPNYDPKKEVQVKDLSDPFNPPPIEKKAPSKKEREALQFARSLGVKKIYQGVKFKFDPDSVDKAGRIHYAPLGKTQPKVDRYFEESRYCNNDKKDLSFVIYTYNGFSEYDPKKWSKKTHCGRSMYYRVQSLKPF